MEYMRTPGKLPPDDDVHIYHIDTNPNVVLGRQCPLCKNGIIPLTNANPYCSDCEKALNEIVKWWGETTWLRQLAENKEQIEKDITESISITTTNPAIKIKK